MDIHRLLVTPDSADEYSYEDLKGFIGSVIGYYQQNPEPPFLDHKKIHMEDDNNKPKLVILGDTHGDYLTTRSAVEEFFFEKPVTDNEHAEPAPGRHLVFLGDYIDRVPRGCENGSLKNLMYVLALKTMYPDRVVLLKGNHEAIAVAPCSPHTFPDELVGLYGSDGYAMLDEFKTLFEQLPVYYRAHNGLLAVHGGIFRQPRTVTELKSLDPLSLNDTAPPTWGEPREYCAPRMGIGEIYNFNRDDFDRFMTAVSASVMVRGHSPDLVGKSIYGGRCLTLFSTETFLRLLGERCSGVVSADLNKRIESVSDLQLYFRSRGNWLPVTAEPMEKDNNH